MYVDDTDIMLAGASHADTPHHIALRAQHAATTYQAAVHQTGGAIRPNRCPWYSISFKWSSGKWRYNKTVTDDTIVIKNTQNVHEPITQLNVSIGWKGLGIVATPDGNWNDHLTYLINEKIVPWSHFINTSYLQRHDVYRAAFTSMFKTITYTLPATFLNTSQCKTIDIHLHKKFLPRIGIDVHLPLAYRYSSPRYQGLGSLNTETTQFVEKLKIFLTHISYDSQLHSLLHATIESHHLLIGSNKFLFSLPFAKYGFLTVNSWITHLWEMLQKYDIQLKGDYKRTHPNREHDVSIMDHIISLNTYNKSDLQAINRCRVYLQVVPPSRHANNKYAFHHATSHIPSHNISPAIVTRFQSSIVHLDSILPNDISPLPVSPHNNHCTLFFIQIQTDPRKEANMTTYLQNHTAIAVTDASFSPYSGIGASSFIISNTELNNCVTGSHGVPPGSNQMDSYRAELYGIFTIMKYLSYLCHKHAITDGEVLIACDNKASLEHALAYDHRASISHCSFDLLWAIHDIKRTLPITIHHQHVRGHQDRTGRPLSLLETLNCFVDKQAGAYRSTIETTHQYHYSTLHRMDNWFCVIDNQIITENITTHITISHPCSSRTYP